MPGLRRDTGTEGRKPAYGTAEPPLWQRGRGRRLRRGPPLRLPNPGADDSRPLRQVPADLCQGAGGLGLPGPALRRPPAGHPLGEHRRPGPRLRFDSRLSHHLPEPRRPHPVRRRQLDRLRRGLQGRRGGQRGAGGHLRPGVRRHHQPRRRGRHPGALHPGAGVRPGRPAHPGRPADPPGADAVLPDAVPDPRRAPAAAPGRGRGRGRRQRRLRGPDGPGVGPVLGHAGLPPHRLRGGNSGLFPLHPGPGGGGLLQPRGADEAAAVPGAGPGGVPVHRLVPPGPGAGQEGPLPGRGRRRGPAGAEPPGGHRAVRRPELDLPRVHVLPALGAGEALLRLRRGLHHGPAPGQAEPHPLHRLFGDSLPLPGSDERLRHGPDFFRGLPRHRLSALRGLRHAGPHLRGHRLCRRPGPAVPPPRAAAVFLLGPHLGGPPGGRLPADPGADVPGLRRPVRPGGRQRPAQIRRRRRHRPGLRLRGRGVGAFDCLHDGPGHRLPGAVRGALGPGGPQQLLHHRRLRRRGHADDSGAAQRLRHAGLPAADWRHLPLRLQRRLQHDFLLGPSGLRQGL